jgi:hypothetical protein
MRPQLALHGPFGIKQLTRCTAIFYAQLLANQYFAGKFRDTLRLTRAASIIYRETRKNT